MTHVRRVILDQVITACTGLGTTRPAPYEDLVEAVAADDSTAIVVATGREIVEDFNKPVEAIAEWLLKRMFFPEVTVIARTPAARDQLCADVEVQFALLTIGKTRRLAGVEFDAVGGVSHRVYAAQLQYEVMYFTLNTTPEVEESLT